MRSRWQLLFNLGVVALLTGLIYLLQPNDNPAAQLLRDHALWPEMILIGCASALALNRFSVLRAEGPLTTLLMMAIAAVASVYLVLMVVSIAPTLIVYEHSRLYSLPMQARAATRYALLMVLLVALCAHFFGQGRTGRGKPWQKGQTRSSNPIPTSDKISHVTAVVSLLAGTAISLVSSPIVSQHYNQPRLVYSTPAYHGDTAVFVVANLGAKRAEEVVIHLRLLPNESVSVAALGTPFSEESEKSIPFADDQVRDHLIKVPSLNPKRMIFVTVNKERDATHKAPDFDDRFASMQIMGVHCSSMSGNEQELTSIVQDSRLQRLHAALAGYEPPGKAIISKQKVYVPEYSVNVIRLSESYSSPIESWATALANRVTGSVSIGEARVLTAFDECIVLGSVEEWRGAIGRYLVEKHTGSSILGNPRKHTLGIVADLAKAGEREVRLLKHITDSEGIPLVILTQ